MLISTSKIFPQMHSSASANCSLAVTGISVLQNSPGHPARALRGSWCLWPHTDHHQKQLHTRALTLTNSLLSRGFIKVSGSRPRGTGHGRDEALQDRTAQWPGSHLHRCHHPPVCPKHLPSSPGMDTAFPRGHREAEALLSPPGTSSVQIMKRNLHRPRDGTEAIPVGAYFCKPGL